MSQKLNYHENKKKRQNLNLKKLKCHPNWNVTKSEMSPKLKYHQNWTVTKTEMSSNWNVTKTEISPNCSVTKSEMSPQLKCYQMLNFIPVWGCSLKELLVMCICSQTLQTSLHVGCFLWTSRRTQRHRRCRTPRRSPRPPATPGRWWRQSACRSRSPEWS